MTPPHDQNVNKSTCCRKNKNSNSRITNNWCLMVQLVLWVQCHCLHVQWYQRDLYHQWCWQCVCPKVRGGLLCSVLLQLHKCLGYVQVFAFQDVLNAIFTGYWYVLKKKTAGNVCNSVILTISQMNILIGTSSGNAPMRVLMDADVSEDHPLVVKRPNQPNVCLIFTGCTEFITDINRQIIYSL